MSNTTFLVSLAAALVIGGLLGWFVHGSPDPVVVESVTVKTVRAVDTIRSTQEARVRTVIERDTIVDHDAAFAEEMLFRFDSLMYEHDRLLDLVATAKDSTDLYALQQEYSYRTREFRHTLTFKQTDTTRTADTDPETWWDKVQKYGFWAVLAVAVVLGLAK